MRVEWSDLALDDLDEIARYIGRDSPFYAREFVERIFDTTDRLAIFPRSGRLVPEAEDHQTREVIVQGYRVMYDIEADQVLILAVIHGSRDINNPQIKP